LQESQFFKREFYNLFMKKVLELKKSELKYNIYFEKEKQFLESKLNGKFWIHHVGSSGIPKLIGKNFLDVQLLVPTKKLALKFLKNLLLFYKLPKTSGGDKFRLFLYRDVKYEKKIRVHLHIMWKTSNHYKDYLDFRKYLLFHPQEVQKYNKVKKELAKSVGPEDISRKKYTEGKTKYILQVLQKVRNS